MSKKNIALTISCVGMAALVAGLIMIFEFPKITANSARSSSSLSFEFFGVFLILGGVLIAALGIILFKYYSLKDRAPSQDEVELETLELLAKQNGQETISKNEFKP